MTSFRGGPADGVTLTLARAPLYLRVACDPRRTPPEWDALDQLGDGPRPYETLLAYRRRGEASTLHVDTRDRQGRRRGEWLTWAEYDHLPDQPADAVMRDMLAWRQWCQARAAEERAHAHD